VALTEDQGFRQECVDDGLDLLDTDVALIGYISRYSDSGQRVPAYWRSGEAPHALSVGATISSLAAESADQFRRKLVVGISPGRGETPVFA
jgi:hypothetical protein